MILRWIDMDTALARLNAWGADKGLLTDTSYSNIALFDGCHWVTARQPLLHGTMRQSLLDDGVLTEQDIKAEDWNSFRQVSLINAMMPLGRLVCKI